jgi:hypothetical protein
MKTKLFFRVVLVTIIATLALGAVIVPAHQNGSASDDYEDLFFGYRNNSVWAYASCERYDVGAQFTPKLGVWRMEWRVILTVNGELEEIAGFWEGISLDEFEIFRRTGPASEIQVDGYIKMYEFYGNRWDKREVDILGFHFSDGICP